MCAATHTPAEMIMSRANADHENMGLGKGKGSRKLTSGCRRIILLRQSSRS